MKTTTEIIHSLFYDAFHFVQITPVSEFEKYNEYSKKFAKAFNRLIKEIKDPDQRDELITWCITDDELLTIEIIATQLNDYEAKRLRRKYGFFKNLFLNDYLEKLDKPKQNTSKAGRKPAEIKPAITYLQGINLPENKTKFLTELKKLYKGAEPKTFNYIIGALEVLNFIKVESRKAIKEAFEKEIEPKKQTQTNFNNDYRDGFPDEKLLESLKSEIVSLRNAKQLF